MRPNGAHTAGGFCIETIWFWLRLPANTENLVPAEPRQRNNNNDAQKKSPKWCMYPQMLVGGQKKTAADGGA